MSDRLNPLLAQWAARLRDGSRARCAQREQDLRILIETSRREAAATTQQDAGQLHRRSEELRRENTALQAEIASLEQTVAARQRLWLETELPRRAALLRQWRERTAAAQHEQQLANLAQVEQLLAGRPAGETCWQAGNEPWTWDSLPARARAQAMGAVRDPDGVVHQVLSRMAARMAAAQEELRALPARRAQIEAAERLVTALTERLARLESALTEDPKRSFGNEALEAYYLDRTGHGLKPENARLLIASALHPLCQDAVLEIAVWQTHIRRELAQLTGDSAP